MIAALAPVIVRRSLTLVGLATRAPLRKILVRASVTYTDDSKLLPLWLVNNLLAQQPCVYVQKIRNYREIERDFDVEW
jgi:hypothetical protein